MALTNTDLKAIRSAVRDEISVANHDLAQHFTASQGTLSKRLDRFEHKLDGVAEDVAKVKGAVVDLLATQEQLHRLVQELKAQGIKLDEQRIFAA